MFALLLAAPLLVTRPTAAVQVSGLDVFRTNCDGCHDLPDPEQPRRSRPEWEKLLRTMVKEKGASLNQQEFAAVLNYLDSFNQPARRVAWKEGPATSHRAAFDASLAGQLPEPWVSLAAGTSEERPWSLQADAGGKSLYLSPSRSAGEGQQQLLIDNSGIVTAGVLSARLRLGTGAGGTGAGILFGFRGVDSYLGVRLSAVTKNVVVYEVSQGQRALVGRAPAPVAPGRWLTLALDLTPGQVTVLLDGKPLLTRPLTGYRGGRAGLATDGATVAAFDQWSVAVAGG
jgi:hypothetical protein